MFSIRFRLLFTTTLILLLFGLILVWSLDRAFRSSAIDVEEEKLKGLVYAILGSVDVNDQGVLMVSEATVSDPRLLSKGSGLSAWIIRENGEPFWNSPSADQGRPASFTSIDTGTWEFRETAQKNGDALFQLRFGVAWVGEGGGAIPFTVVVVENRDAFNRQLATYHQTLWRWLIVAAIALVLAWTFVLRWGLAPLRGAVTELRAIENGKQGALEGKYPAEITPLAEGINALLRHERSQQKRYRNALDDLAHSLKTPLAALRGLAHSSESWKEGREVASAQLEQINKIVEYQIRHASIAGRRAFAHPLSVRTVAEKIVGALEKVYREKSLRFEIEIPSSLQIAADEGDVMEVFGNLLENASKWAKSLVRASACIEEDEFRLTVEDDGPGFPPGEPERLLERGVRADLRVPGQGIGLSVVREVVNLYEGKITLGASPSGGAKVSITLPI